MHIDTHTPALGSGPDLLILPVAQFASDGTPRLVESRATIALVLAPQPLTNAPIVAVCRRLPDGSLAVLGYAAARADSMPKVAPAASADEPLVIAHGRSSIELYADGRVRICGDDVRVEADGRLAFAGGHIELN